MTWTDTSKTVMTVRSVVGTLESAYRRSRFGHAGRQARNLVAVGLDHSLSVRTLRRCLYGSSLRRLLVTDRTPSVVRLDLRETLVFGWVVVGLARVLDTRQARRPLTRITDICERVWCRFAAAPVGWSGAVVAGGVGVNIATTGALTAGTPRGLGWKLIILGVALVATRLGR